MHPLRSLLLPFALLLLAAPTFAAAPSGAWWNTAYGYRQQINIPAGATALPANYAVSVVFDHATEVSAARALASGNDVRMVRWNGSAWLELDRIADPDTPWNTSTTRLWFRTAQAVNAGASDDNYYLYFDNPAGGAPPQTAENIFLLYDDFSTSLAASRWTASGGVSITSGAVRLNPNASLTSTAAYSFGVDTIWESRARMTLTYGDFDYWGASASATLYLRFQADGNSHQAVANDLSGPSLAPFSPVTATSFQNYSFTREGADIARFLINGAQVAAFIASEGPMSNLRVSVENNEGGERLFYDWARVRPYRKPDPLLTLNAAEQPPAVAEWRLEQASWNGASGEVQDSGPNSLHLTSVQSGGSGANTAIATPAKPGNPGTCRYGQFDGVNDYLQVADNPVLEPTARLSVATWIYPRALASGGEVKTIVSKDTNYEFHLNSSGQVYWWWGGGAQQLTTAAAVPLNQWSHIAITYASGAQRIYINGVLRASSSATGSLSTNNLPFQIGQDQGAAGRYWNGFIDEVRLYNRALTAAEVAATMNTAHPCAAAAPHFVITHDDYGIHCAAEQITIDVRDAANNPNSSYNSLVVLDTGSGAGSWSRVSGGGSFADGAANDGVATYQWPMGESTAIFSLTYRQGAAVIDIDAWQSSDPSIRDDDTEGAMTFSQSGFTVTSTALSNPPPASVPAFVSPQTAGSDFAIHIAAYGQTPTDPECGVIETYTGIRSLNFWSTYSNPATGTLTVAVDGAAIATLETSAAAQNVAFTSGQAIAVASYKDAGRIAISMKDNSAVHPDLPTGTRGSTGDVVFKPASFELSQIRRTDNGAVNPAAADASGPVFLPAGAEFSATVTARDAAGDATPNYGRETPAESVALISNLAAPVGGVNPPIAAATGFAGFTNGSATATDLGWGEVGVITLTPQVRDGDYLGAGNVIGVASTSVGRFTPFTLEAIANTPQFQTACASGAFTYVGQRFGYAIPPVISVTARAVGGGVTQNYTGSFFKLTNASLSGRSYDAGAASLDINGLPATSGDPAIVDLAAGLSTLTFSAGSGIALARAAPVAALNAQLTLSISVQDSDGVAYPANPLTIGAAGGIPFNSGNQQRYGRIAFRNAVGSELLNLPAPLRSEYFISDDAGFAVNSADTCTTGVTLSLSSFGGNLAAGETCVLDSGAPGVSGAGCSAAALIPQRFRLPPQGPNGGDFNLILRAPGANNDGVVTITSDVPDWLEFDWNGVTPGLENPSGIATFGIFQGNSKRLYQRERY